MVTFDLLVKRGLTQIKGSMNGPTQRKDITKDQVLKYHFSCFCSSMLIYPGFMHSA